MIYAVFFFFVLFFCVYNSFSRYHLVLFRLRVREERVTEKIASLVSRPEVVWFPDPSCMGGQRAAKEGSGE